MSVEQAKIPWHRHPLAAIALGSVIAAGLAVPTLKYGLPYCGTDALLLVMLIVPAVSGFVVGFMCPQHGAVWGALSSVPPVWIAASRLAFSAERPMPDVAPEMLPIIAMSALVSAVFGGLGSRMTEMPPRSRKLMTIAVIVSFPVIAGACFLKVKLEMDLFEKGVLPVFERRFSENVIRLSPNTAWELRRVNAGFRSRHVIEAVTRIRGHRLFLTLDPAGSSIRRCVYSYEPPRRVQFTGEASVRRYLADFGVSAKALGRLKVTMTPEFSARSWFCASQLLPKPEVSPCAKRPLCGSDCALYVREDGTIRIRLRPNGSGLRRTSPPFRH
jgi:hypothetical protein